MNQFSIRVYGILFDENKRVLLSDEYIRGMLITKFPGGGLEFGEGTRDCLVREFKEELNLSVSVGKHIYTTDFFQFNGEYIRNYSKRMLYEKAFQNIVVPDKEIVLLMNIIFGVNALLAKLEAAGDFRSCFTAQKKAPAADSGD